jgi:hypothetical protein
MTGRRPGGYSAFKTYAAERKTGRFDPLFGFVLWCIRLRSAAHLFSSSAI